MFGWTLNTSQVAFLNRDTLHFNFNVSAGYVSQQYMSQFPALNNILFINYLNFKNF